MGENMLSSFISNLGAVKMSPEAEKFVETFEFVPAPSPVMRTNASVLSYRGQLIVCFGSLNAEPELERRFFKKLASLGIAVRVESNVGA
jgi:hypothetical protein